MTGLGEFLLSRRTALRPEDIGLEADDRRRRVAGLRREELAAAAGVSVAYYTRLEQGLSRNASDGVLDALARVLRLNAEERTHLRSLANPPRRTAPPPPERVRPGVRSVLDALGGVPALILGRRLEILAWNRLAHSLLAGHLPFECVDDSAQRPDIARLVFLDPHALDLYEEWGTKAEEAVAHLRLVAGRHPDDVGLAALVGELTVRSAFFADLWNAHPVSSCSYAVRGYHHPLVGRLVLHEEVVQLADPGQSLAVFTAETGSPSAAALHLLARLTAVS